MKGRSDLTFHKDSPEAENCNNDLSTPTYTTTGSLSSSSLSSSPTTPSTMKIEVEEGVYLPGRGGGDGEEESSSVEPPLFFSLLSILILNSSLPLLLLSLSVYLEL